MFDNFGFEITSILKKAEEERYSLKHPYVGSEHLLLAILKEEGSLKERLHEYGITYDSFRNELCNIVGKSSSVATINLYTPLLKRILENALDDAKEDNDGVVTKEHLIISIIEEGEGIAIRLLVGMGIEIEEIYNELKELKKKSNVSKDLEIFKIGTDLNKYVSLDEKVIGRDKEINLIIETLLRKKKNNPILVGSAGVGKTAIVEELVRRIEKGEVPNHLKNKKVVMLEMGSLISGTKYRGEFEERLTKIIEELKQNPDIIVFIDEIHTMVNAGGAEGAINAGDILKPYLARGDIKCIGATTTNEYYQYIAKDKALERRFDIIKIEEPNPEETLKILKNVKNEYEKHHDITISDENVADIVEYANQYIFNKNNPDKSLELLDSICSHIKSKNEIKSNDNNDLKLLNKKKQEYVKAGDFKKAIYYKTLEQEKLKFKDEKNELVITKNDILQVLGMKSNISLLEDKDEVLKKLKTRLEKNILGQESIISNIIKSLGNESNEKPLSLLFVGPSGVGKTQTVKEIASVITPNNKIIRLDMSEYNQDISINKLIGAPSGYVGYDDEYIFRKVKDNPRSIILIDEVEKANSRVLNLFLQILDEGKITDSKGEVINFSKCLIFMTSNISVQNKVGFTNTIKDDLEEVLSKELLGRLDNIIVFNKISKEIAIEFIKSKIDCSEEDIEQIIEKSDYEKYGMRNIMLNIKKYIKENNTEENECDKIKV